MAIEIRNITKSYGSKKVVDNVSVTIPTGKITSFIGPNGAGKSTVLSTGGTRDVRRHNSQTVLLPV